MHNNIMVVGSRDHPLMLATVRYPQWRSRFIRYIDTRPNGDALRKCILNGPYIPATVVVQAVAATNDSLAIPEHTTPEWSRFMTVVKQQHKLDEVSYHKLFDILNQYQKEVNELRPERLARNANPLALVATAQANQDPYYQTSKSQKSYAPSSKPSIPTRSHTTTRYKDKEIAKPITPSSESASEEDNDPEQAQRDKDIQKNLALIAKYLKKIYKPTNNNLRTSSNLRNKNVDTTLRYKDDNQSRQFGNQRTMNVAGARENVGSPVVQQSGIQCFNYTDEEIDEQELDAHYNYMEKIHEVPTIDSCTDSEPLEQIQKQLMKANTTLAQELKECKTILAETSKTLEESNSVRDSCLVALQNKQIEFEKYKAFNDRTLNYDKPKRKLNETLGHLAQKDIEIKEGLKLKAYEISVVKEKHYELIKQSLLTKSHYEGLVKEKTKVIMDLKLKEENDIDKMLSMEKQLKFLNKIVYKRNQSIQTIHMMAPKVKHTKDQFRAPTAQDMDILIKICLMPLALKTQNDSFIFVHELKQKMHADLKYVESLEKEIDKLKSDKAEFSNMYDMILSLNANAVCTTCGKCLVDSDHFACVTKMLNDVNARTKKPNKHMMGNLKLLCNFAEKFLGTVYFVNDQFAPVLGYGDFVQGNMTINRVYYVEGLNRNLFSVSQFCDADLEIAFRKSTCFIRDLQGNDLLTGNHRYDLYTISHQESTSLTPICLMAKASPTQAWLWHQRLSHLNFDYINLISKKDVVIGLSKLKYVKDQLCSSCEVSKAKRSSFKSKAIPSLKEMLNLLHMDLCGPMRVASINRKKYILVIVDDYSRYTWTLFLRAKDETPKVLKEFLMMIQRNLQALVITVRIDRGTEFLNKTLNEFFKEEGIEHQTSTTRTPKQNDVVERQNRTLVEAA
nr:retrovirus-related Pol polyprotein from transposon TNT 1-94 [Tanacetum cinerariifolium]